MYISRAERPIHIERAAERALEPTQRELRRQRESGAREPARKLTPHVAAPRERACVPLDSHRLRADSEGARARATVRRAGVRTEVAVIDYYSTCDDAVAAYVERIRALARGGPVSWRMVLFAPDTAGCRPIEIDPSDTNDLDAEITWAANRVARIIGATAAAFVNEIPTRGAVVCVERRGASELECFVIGRGEAPPRRETSREAFWLLPGGDPDDGWGWQDHDSLDLDRNQQSLRPARDTEEGGG